MSSMTGDVVELSTSIVKGYPYYLSTARSKHNYFAKLQYGLQRPGTTTFNLDGDIINRHYKATPVDYFRSGFGGGSDETEDRIYSKKPLLPINCVTEIHIYAGNHILMDSTLSLKLRKVAILAKRRGIPIYFYNHIRYLEDQNKSEALSGKELMTTLGKVGGEIAKNDLPQEKEPRKDLKNWIRLLTAKDVAHLTTDQKFLLMQIANGYGDLNLGDTMMYSGKPGGKSYEYVNWLNQYMMKYKIKDTHSLVMRIRQKYDLF
ncbi:hypothetical protein GHT06_001877 [Daphnia sinensis]|uniref:Uncharacterized protein n=1 Tax=Daphnia sinensis TaxID=1820382 RepID=A0AAD5KDK3_9CRUS|nr:hypothetical protein GHT06_001877 [Daphnia sinensis]